MDSLIQLQSLTFTPASGSASLSLAPNNFGYLVNSEGNLVIGACPFAIPGASMNCAVATAPPSAFIAGHVDLNYAGSVMGFASVGMYGSLTLSGPSVPETVDVHVIAPYSQILQSDIDIASSNVTLRIYVDGTTIVNFVSQYDLTRGQFVSDSGVLDLHTPMILTPGGSYSISVQLSDGVRANPEPSTLWLLGGGLLPGLIRLGRSKLLSRSHPQP
jgi:hypothetical protein